MSQAEGVCLRHPENLGFHQTVNLENASNMLMRAVSMAQHVPYQWAYIDKPQGGQRTLPWPSKDSTEFLVALKRDR
jgi:hypothetical protein